MLHFAKLRREDYDTAAEIMINSGFGSTECSFPCIFMWRNMYDAEICIDEGTVYIRAGGRRGYTYLFPFGGDMREAFLKIRRETGGEAVCFHSITGRMRDMITKAFPGEFNFYESRSSYDYIYESESLASLSGKKLHKKRNHVNKFIKEYEGRFEYSPLRKEDSGAIMDFQRRWESMAADDRSRAALEYETGAIEELFDCFDDLKIVGGKICIDGNVAAYCLGARAGKDTFDVMVEKGDYAYDGIYQAINKFFAESICDKFKFINREDDAGDPGLRKSKLSYAPALILKKYTAVWKR